MHIKKRHDEYQLNASHPASWSSARIGMRNRYDESNPELRVNFFLKVEDRQEIRSTPTSGGFYGYRFYTWGGVNIDTVEYKAGTLSIDLVDAGRNALVWHGLAEGRVRDDAVRNPGPAIGSAVAEIFGAFPGSAS